MSRRIAILGVNGRVGAELAVALHQDGCDVTGLLRARGGAVLCSLAGIPYRLTGADTDLREFDTVIDAAIPSGDSATLRREIQGCIDRWLTAMKPGATYVYLSSIMALGMPPTEDRARFHRVPRTSYGYAKRCAERFAARLGRARHVRVIALRLGQVHGHFQAASHDFIDKLSRSEVLVNGQPDDLTTTVFVSELAAFFAGAAESTLSPGMYHAVSSPQWRQADLLEYFRRRHGGSATVQYGAALPSPGTLDRLRQFAESYVLGEIPVLAVPLKGWYRTRQASTPQHARERALLLNVLGRCPDPTLPLALTRSEVECRNAALADSMRALLALGVT
jgi:nucleoside-diphosphate-sugar epimerase